MKFTSLAGAAELKLTLGRNIRRGRHGHGWSQVQLANAAGLSISMIGKLEAGRANPRISTLEAVAKALDVAPKTLLMQDD